MTAPGDGVYLAPDLDQGNGADEPDCHICSEPIECSSDCYDYESDGRCHCGTRSHCCYCGGSPYCDCCPKCKKCVATCGCPIAMKLQDGSEVIL